MRLLKYSQWAALACCQRQLLFRYWSLSQCQARITFLCSLCIFSEWTIDYIDYILVFWFVLNWGSAVECADDFIRRWWWCKATWFQPSSWQVWMRLPRVAKPKKYNIMNHSWINYIEPYPIHIYSYLYLQIIIYLYIIILYNISHNQSSCAAPQTEADWAHYCTSNFEVDKGRCHLEWFGGRFSSTPHEPFDWEGEVRC